MNAKLNFSFAAPPDPTQVNQATGNNVSQAFVAPKPCLYDFTKAQGPVDPQEELERYLQASSSFLPLHKNGVANDTEKRLLDFNFFLSHNQQCSAEFATAQPIPFPDFAENFVAAAWRLRQKYSAASNGQEAPPVFRQDVLFAKRFRNIYFWLWYSVLGLNVERIAEFPHWVELMETACCATQLDNVAICIKLLAGQSADDRDSYLAKLRPHFIKHSQRLGEKHITCDCGEGLPHA